MTDRDALLEAILDSPDDETPRLAYLDWIQENGDFHNSVEDLFNLDYRIDEIVMPTAVWLAHGDRIADTLQPRRVTLGRPASDCFAEHHRGSYRLKSRTDYFKESEIMKAGKRKYYSMRIWPGLLKLTWPTVEIECVEFGIEMICSISQNLYRY